MKNEDETYAINCNHYIVAFTEMDDQTIYLIFSKFFEEKQEYIADIQMTP